LLVSDDIASAAIDFDVLAVNDRHYCVDWAGCGNFVSVVGVVVVVDGIGHGSVAIVMTQKIDGVSLPDFYHFADCDRRHIEAMMIGVLSISKPMAHAMKMDFDYRSDFCCGLILRLLQILNAVAIWMVPMRENRCFWHSVSVV